MRSPIEWKYFNDNLLSFQGNGPSEEADNYSVYQFSAFAKSWNDWVDSLKYEHPEVTYKTASHLKDAYQSMKKKAVKDSTLRQHDTKIKELRKRHTNEDMNRSFAQEFAEPTAATTAKAVYRAIGTQTNVSGGHTESITDSRTPVQLSKRHISRDGKRRSTRKSKSRCRKCGKEYALPEWVPFHVNNVPSKETWTGRPQDRNLKNSEGNKVWDICTVLASQYEVGFPALDPNKRMPKRRRDDIT